MLITDTRGQKSLTATLTVVGFVLIMVKIMFSGASISVGNFSYTFGTIDGLVVGAVFGPLFGSYTARRWNDVPEDSGSKPGDGAK